MNRLRKPKELAADLVYLTDAERQYQCALAVAYPPECGPPPWCAMTIDPVLEQGPITCAVCDSDFEPEQQ